MAIFKDCLWMRLTTKIGFTKNLPKMHEKSTAKPAVLSFVKTYSVAIPHGLFLQRLCENAC